MQTLTQTLRTSLIQSFEAHYRSDHDNEHAILLDTFGRLIVERTGGVDIVSFTPEELERGCAGFIDHSHPHCLSLSGADLALAAQYGMTIRAFGVTPDTGIAYDYTAQMPLPSLPLADRIYEAFTDAVTAAEQQLANSGLSDREWQREARHQTNILLAQRFGYIYTRTVAIPSSPIHEMTSPTSHEIRRLDALASIDDRLRSDVFSPLHAHITRILTQNAGSGGVIPLPRLDTIRQQVAALVQSTILGRPGQDGIVQPYATYRGKVTPKSPYFAALWGGMKNATVVAIDEQADIIRKHLPADLIRSGEMSYINPFATSVHEIDDDPIPEPLHERLLADGKRLIDRVWGVAGDLRRKLDQYIVESVGSGKPVQLMDAELEKYLLYQGDERIDEQWRTLNYESFRLARTEVANSHSRSSWLAAQRNPFVVTYRPFTQPQHRCCDNCDDEEKNGPYPKDDLSHLPTFHTNCICGILWYEVDDPGSIVARLRTEIEQSIVAAKASFFDFIGPLSKRFRGLLFGEDR